MLERSLAALATHPEVDEVVVALPRGHLDPAPDCVTRVLAVCGEGRGGRRPAPGLGGAARLPPCVPTPTSCWCTTPRGRLSARLSISRIDRGRRRQRRGDSRRARHRHGEARAGAGRRDVGGRDVAARRGLPRADPAGVPARRAGAGAGCRRRPTPSPTKPAWWNGPAAPCSSSTARRRNVKITTRRRFGRCPRARPAGWRPAHRIGTGYDLHRLVPGRRAGARRRRGSPSTSGSTVTPTPTSSATP